MRLDARFVVVPKKIPAMIFSAPTVRFVTMAIVDVQTVQRRTHLARAAHPMRSTVQVSATVMPRRIVRADVMAMLQKIAQARVMAMLQKTVRVYAMAMLKKTVQVHAMVTRSLIV
tara:strand:- start:372 stop:716 length:345 start_codon:yes stop_codon:yes gene_type:complete